MTITKISKDRPMFRTCGLGLKLLLLIKLINCHKKNEHVHFGHD